MRKLLLFLLLAVTLQAFPQTPKPIPITGNLQGISGSPQPYAGILIQLQNCPSPVTVTGYAGIVALTYQLQANASGVINSTIWANDQITCNGTTGASEYSEVAVVNGVPSGTPQCYQVTSAQGIWNLNTQQPIACSQTPPNPQDASYQNITASGFVQGVNAALSGTLSVTGAMTAGSVNGIANPTGQTGSDFGAQANAAFAAACTSSTGCEVDVPASSTPYQISTTINVPRVSSGSVTLKCNGGAVLDYTGTGDMITNSEPNGTANSIVTIEGCTLFGSDAGNGIHLYPGNEVRLVGNLIYGFGNGVLDDGSEVVTLTDNWILGNQTGVLEEGSGCTTTTPVTCSNANYLQTGYTSYAPNALHAMRGGIANNAQWGAQVTDAGLNNSYAYVDFEGNGTAGSTYGAVLDAKSVGDAYEHDYFEGSPHYIEVGTSTTAASGTQVIGNYFTIPNASGDTVELVNSNTATVNRNIENSATGSVNSCFINVTTANYLQSFSNTEEDGNEFCTSGAAGSTNTTFLYTDTNNWLHLTNIVSPGALSFQSQSGFAFNNSTGSNQNFGCSDAGVCQMAGTSASLSVPVVKAPAVLQLLPGTSLTLQPGSGGQINNSNASYQNMGWTDTGAFTFNGANHSISVGGGAAIANSNTVVQTSATAAGGTCTANGYISATFNGVTLHLATCQ